MVDKSYATDVDRSFAGTKYLIAEDPVLWRRFAAWEVPADE